MALGSGSSLATDCSTRRSGSPASLQLLRDGLASRLNQLSSKKPTTHSGRPSARPINQSRRLFSSVLGIWGSDPPLGSLPTYPHARKRCPDRKSTRLNSSHTVISYAVFCLKKKKQKQE